jgi:hypothetical protein
LKEPTGVLFALAMTMSLADMLISLSSDGGVGFDCSGFYTIRRGAPVIQSVQFSYKRCGARSQRPAGR